MALGWKKDYLRYKELFLKVLVVYKKREDLQIFLEIFLSLITITFFSVFALKPTVLTISELVKTNKEKQKTVNEMSQKIKDISTAQKVYEQYYEKIPIIEYSIPENPTPETFLRQIEGVAYLNSVNVLGSSVNEILLLGEEDDKKSKKDTVNLPANVKVLNFSFNVSGDYFSLLNFLTNMENLRRPLVINSINVTSTDTESGKIIIMLISGQTPYLKK